MKIKCSIVSIAACAAVITFAGCSKSEKPVTESSGGPATAATTNVTAVTDAVKDTAVKAADAAKDAASQAAAAATNAATAATGPFTDGIAAAQKFIADKNYQGALDELNKLSGLQLSADQQKTVADLKDQATKLLSGGAAGAVDATKNLLGK